MVCNNSSHVSIMAIEKLGGSLIYNDFDMKNDALSEKLKNKKRSLMVAKGIVEGCNVACAAGGLVGLVTGPFALAGAAFLHYYTPDPMLPMVARQWADTILAVLVTQGALISGGIFATQRIEKHLSDKTKALRFTTNDEKEGMLLFKKALIESEIMNYKVQSMMPLKNSVDLSFLNLGKGAKINKVLFEPGSLNIPIVARVEISLNNETYLLDMKLDEFKKLVPI